jgi:hypothetical protein
MDEHIQTDEFLAPVKKEKTDKVDLFYKASRIYLIGGTGLDMSTTTQVLSHPTLASKPNGSVLAHYYGVESGWARFLGQRNTGAVVSANVALDTGISMFTRRLYQKGGRMRVLAVAINVLQGTGGAVAAFRNNRVSESVDKQVRQRTGYRGTIIWSH